MNMNELSPLEREMIEAYRIGKALKAEAAANSARRTHTREEVLTTGNRALDAQIEAFVEAHEQKLLKKLKRASHQDEDVLNASIYHAADMLKTMVQEGTFSVDLQSNDGKYAAMKMIFSLAKSYNAIFD